MKDQCILFLKGFKGFFKAAATSLDWEFIGGIAAFTLVMILGMTLLVLILTYIFGPKYSTEYPVQGTPCVIEVYTSSNPRLVCTSTTKEK